MHDTWDLPQSSTVSYPSDDFHRLMSGFRILMCFQINKTTVTSYNNSMFNIAIEDKQLILRTPYWLKVTFDGRAVDINVNSRYRNKASRMLVYVLAFAAAVRLPAVCETKQGSTKFLGTIAIKKGDFRAVLLTWYRVLRCKCVSSPTRVLSTVIPPDSPYFAWYFSELANKPFCAHKTFLTHSFHS